MPGARAQEHPGSPAARAARLGLVRDWDFLLHLPLRYVDETRIVPVAQLAPGAPPRVRHRR